MKSLAEANKLRCASSVSLEPSGSAIPQMIRFSPSLAFSLEMYGQKFQTSSSYRLITTGEPAVSTAAETGKRAFAGKSDLPGE
ncbi:hypothetical protein I5G39_000245 [Pseudomonas aeruginosa]|nr:hypothetical protein [Pseudomonas aeruginosa]